MWPQNLEGKKKKCCLTGPLIFFPLYLGSIIKSMLESEIEKEITETQPRTIESLVLVGRVKARARDVLYDINTGRMSDQILDG